MEIHKNCTGEEELMMDIQPTGQCLPLKPYRSKIFPIHVIMALSRMCYDNRRR